MKPIILVIVMSAGFMYLLLHNTGNNNIKTLDQRQVNKLKDSDTLVNNTLYNNTEGQETLKWLLW